MNEHHEPDKAKTYVLGFSGGKDSVASYLYMKSLGLKVICVFADTGHEAPDLYEYLDLLECEHGFEIVRVHCTLGQFADEKELTPWKICTRLNLFESPVVAAQMKTLENIVRARGEGFKDSAAVAEKLFDSFEPTGWREVPLGMEQLVILKRRFPSKTRRFCTTVLKLVPQKVWLKRWLETLSAVDVSRVVRVSGVRAEESAARAKHKTWEFDDFMGCWLWLPIHKWSHKEVFDIHDEFGVPPNPLYKKGCGRVGCFPCINSSKAELRAIARNTSGLIQLRGMEERVADAVGKPAMSFFSHDKTPDRFHSHFCEQSGKSFPDANDVAAWSTSDDPDPNQMHLFKEDDDEDSDSCSSIYGLCE